MVTVTVTVRVTTPSFSDLSLTVSSNVRMRCLIRAMRSLLRASLAPKNSLLKVETGKENQFVINVSRADGWKQVIDD